MLHATKISDRKTTEKKPGEVPLVILCYFAEKFFNMFGETQHVKFLSDRGEYNEIMEIIRKVDNISTLLVLSQKPKSPSKLPSISACRKSF